MRVTQDCIFIAQEGWGGLCEGVYYKVIEDGCRNTASLNWDKLESKHKGSETAMMPNEYWSWEVMNT